LVRKATPYGRPTCQEGGKERVQKEKIAGWAYQAELSVKTMDNALSFA